MRLLLATIRPDIRLSLELLLGEQPGVEIVGTVSESEGLLALIHTTRPDMIVTDWDLPGRPLSIILQEVQSTTPLQIILLVNDGDDYQTILQNIKANAIVLKGSSPAILLDTFHKIRTNQ